MDDEYVCIDIALGIFWVDFGKGKFGVLRTWTNDSVGFEYKNKLNKNAWE